MKFNILALLLIMAVTVSSEDEEDATGDLFQGTCEFFNLENQNLAAGGEFKTTVSLTDGQTMQCISVGGTFQVDELDIELVSVTKMKLCEDLRAMKLAHIPPSFSNV